MAEIKGKFITLACDLIKSKPQARAAAVDAVKKSTGAEPEALEPEAFYDTKVLNSVFTAIEQDSPGVVGAASIKFIGRLVYPTIKNTAGLPDHLKTPLDFVKFEGDGFLANHRGPDVVPRRFEKLEEGHVIVEAPSPGYNCIFIEGVFEGILGMVGVAGASVRQTQCARKGDNTCVYDIKW